MTGRTKALFVILGLAAVLLVGIASVVLLFGAVPRRLPSRGLLVLDISGPLPERSPDSPLAEMFSDRTVSRQDVRDGLVRAAGDPHIHAVRVKVGDIGAGMATVQEIRDLLARVEAAGKPTMAYLETAGEFAPGNTQYYLASACRRVVLSPLGDVNLTGLSLRTPFARGTLDKLGIEPDFPGIGDYKTARFLYTEKEFTPAHREMMQWLADSLSSQLVAGIARSRKLDPAVVRELFARGPFIGPEALDLKLVDALEDWSDFVEESREGGELEEISLRRYLRSGRPDQSGAPIAVIFAEGGIQRGESGYSPVPLFGGDVMGSETIARAWRDVRDAKPRAVIFRVNSPGGSAIASEIIRAEMARTAKDIPVVVSMGDVAGSGGYWVTCGAQKIVADPATITASIGVFGGHLAMSKFWEDKLGVTWGRLDTEPNAAIFGSLDPWTPEQRARIQKFLDRIYDDFLTRVADSRKMTKAQVDAIGRGRVFTGEQALSKGLVDRVGGFDEALAVARELAGIGPDADVELTFYPRTRPFWERVLGAAEGSRSSNLVRSVAALREPRSIVLGPVWAAPIEVR